MFLAVVVTTHATKVFSFPLSFGVLRRRVLLAFVHGLEENWLTLLGLFLAIPNSVTLLTFVMGGVLIQIQVRLEEEFLARTHGEKYAQYRRSVRRWL